MRRSTFCADDQALLLKLRDVEKRQWKWIAEAFPSRTMAVLQQRYYAIKRNAAPKRAGRPSIQQAPAPSVMSRAVHASRLVIDAELRGRIELQGITAGLLGDPLPGRSALDHRSAGAFDSSPRIDRRSGGPKPTLSQGS